MRRSLAALCVLLGAPAAHGDEGAGEAHAALHLFIEPAPSQQLVVVTPSVTAQANLRSWLSASVDWTSDIVSGATPRTYGADVVSGATPFQELRNAVGAHVEARSGAVSAQAGYRFGIEHDYRSQVVIVGSRLDLFQHNTILAATYAHNFDSVCDLDHRGLPVTLRQPLGTSTGCFSSQSGLTEEPLAIDGAELALTQTLTPRLALSLVGFFEHVDGFQSNPYRRVRLDGGTIEAQESHPRLRDRGGVGARGRYALAHRASLGLDLRLYRDSWEIESITAEASWDQLAFSDRIRVRLRARYYEQSRAFFYRDAGDANSYERTGPVGAFFTGDREMAPFADVLVGGSLGYRSRAGRTLRFIRSFEGALRLDLIKVFALTPAPPNAPRAHNVVDALLLGLSLSGTL